MNYLQMVLGFLLGLYVPAVNSSGVILALNPHGIERHCRMQLLKVQAAIEIAAIVLAYYGIPSGKTTLGIELDGVNYVDINTIICVFGCIMLILCTYLLAIQLYISINKGLTYKLVGLGYTVMYCLTAIQYNPIIIGLLVGASALSVKLLKKAPAEIRTLTFCLTTLI